MRVNAAGAWRAHPTGGAGDMQAVEVCSVSLFPWGAGTHDGSIEGTVAGRGMPAGVGGRGLLCLAVHVGIFFGLRAGTYDGCGLDRRQCRRPRDAGGRCLLCLVALFWGFLDRLALDSGRMRSLRQLLLALHGLHAGVAF